MAYSITDTYKMKREIINFAKKFSGGLSAPDKRFLADMTYGILASQSCLLTRIAQSLQEDEKKIYTVRVSSGRFWPTTSFDRIVSVRTVPIDSKM